MKRHFLSGLMLLTAAASFAQNKIRTELSGTVTDKSTQSPLTGASVTLSDSRIGTQTDSNGHYHLFNIPSGHVLIEVSYAGYKTLVEHLDLSGSTTKHFTLSPSILVNQGVTVTAVAGATSIRKAPIPITRINKEDLLNQPSTNIVDALSKQPGVSQLSTGPAISKPIIRGLGYNRLVVINDGIRQEGQQWGDEHGIEIDENSVSRVEIVKGPASLIYGSDALAGVINIITTVPAPENTLKGSLLSSYSTNNRQRSFFGTVAGNNKGFNWSAWGDYKAAIDYKNKWDNRVFNSKFNEQNFGGHVGYNGSWGYSHFIVSNFHQKLGVIEGERNPLGQFTRPLPGGMETAATTTDFESTQPQVPYQNVNHLKLTSENSFHAGKGRLSLNLGWQQNQRKEFGNADAPTEPELFFDLKTFNYSVAYHITDRNGWNYSIGAGGMQQSNQNRAPEVLIPAYRLFDIGSFIFLQKTKGDYTFSGGVRFDNRTLHSDGLTEGSVTKFSPFNKNFSNVSGSAGVSYAPTEKLLLKLNIARGFRAPSIPELASNGTHEGTNRYEYGNKDLKSESSWQLDAGIELNSDHVLFTANAFYNRIRNFIFYSKLLNASANDSLVEVNGNFIPAFGFAQRNASLYGTEALIDIHPHPLDWLHWANTFSYVRGQFASAIEGTQNVPLIPAARWISEVRVEFLKSGNVVRNLSIHAEVDHTFEQGKAFTAYQTETPTPGYTLLNASVSANIVAKNKTLFSLYFMGSNLGDVAYQAHLSRLKYTAVNEATGRRGVYNIGRNFTVKVNVPLNFKM